MMGGGGGGSAIGCDVCLNQLRKASGMGGNYCDEWVERYVVRLASIGRGDAH